jgi:hypothetical protein
MREVCKWNGSAECETGWFASVSGLEGASQGMWSTGRRSLSGLFALLMWAVLLPVLSGCGTGGYIGGGISAMSRTSATIDATQSIGISASASSGLPLSWALNPVSCTAGSCGTLSATSGASITYSAPTNVPTSFQVQLVASVQGTSDQKMTMITVNPAPKIVGTPPGGTVNTPYTTTLTTSGGTGTLTLTQSAGTLPPGLAFNSTTGVLSGTPTTAGTFTATFSVTDQSDIPMTVTTPESITISAGTTAGLAISGAPGNGTVGTAYTAQLMASGGVAPYSWSLSSGSLPPGLALSASGGLIAGTPTTAGTYAFTAHVMDSAGNTASAPFVISVANGSSGLTLTASSLPNGTVNTPYSATIGVTGGTSPYSCVAVGGSLPGGLTLNANCSVTGTPTTAGTSIVTVKATDSASPANSVTGPESITINASGVTLTTTNPPNGTVNTPYTGSIGVAGGTGPYGCSLVSGTLPAGLTLNANCSLSGTPTTSGSSTVTVKVTDSSSPTPNTSNNQVTITINPTNVTLTLSNPPAGTVDTVYTGSIGVAGGTGPYSCSLVSGTLPAGLTLNANCSLTGTPTTAGTSSVTVKVTDSATPTANSSTGSVSITIDPSTTMLTLSNPPAGTVDTAYTGAVGVAGGKGPYSCSLVSGSVPAGLTLNTNCSLTGTPSTAGTSNFSVKATDSTSPTPISSTGAVSLTINAPTATLTLSNPPAGTVDTPYVGAVGVAGGSGPYSCSLVSGTLPAGLTLNTNCSLTGTPSTAGTSNFTVKATDSTSPTPISSTGAVSLTINASTITLTLSNPPSGTVNSPYSGSVGVAGGTAPYSCILAGGSVPAGLTLNSNCSLSGTPTTQGTSTFSVKATDGATPTSNTTTGSVSLTINPSGATLTLSSPPAGTVDVAYAGSIGVAGGTGPYSCSLVSGTLPAGLTLNNNCSLTGTPTTAGISNVTVKATDSATPTANTTTGAVSITINPSAVTLALSNPPAGTVDVAYTGSIGVTGGTTPISCALVSGTLPAGLTLNNNCSLTGTPTTAGATTISVKATDSATPTANTTTGPVTITINPSAVTLALANPPDGTVGVVYTGSVGVTGGTTPYSCSLVSGAVPAGLTLNSNCSLTGTPTTAGPSTFTVKVTDSATPTANTVTGPVTVTIQAATKLTLTISGQLPNATLNQPYTYTLQAQGGVQPYTFALTGGSLPPGISLSPSGVISGTPTQVGASSFTVTVTDTESTPQTASAQLVLLVVYPTTPYDPELSGPYAFLFNGYDDAVLGVLSYKTATVGSFTADGTGVLTTGELDSNHQTTTGTKVATQTLLGTYTLDSATHGTMVVTPINADGTTAQSSTYTISLVAPTAPATTATQGDLVETDTNSLNGTKGAGNFLAQTSSSFATGLTGSYAFGVSGDTPCLLSCAANLNLTGGPAATAGEFTMNGSSFTGTSDYVIAATATNAVSTSGTAGTADSNGRLQFTMTTAGSPTAYPTDYAVYMVNGSQAFIMSTDVHSTSILLAGSMTQQTAGAAASTSITGPYVGYENAAINPGLVNGLLLQNTLDLGTATVFRGTGNAATCNTTNVDVGGLSGLTNSLGNLLGGLLSGVLGSTELTGNSSCASATGGPTGRIVYKYVSPLLSAPPSPRVVYLYGPGSGYFVETSYAGIGQIVQQSYPAGQTQFSLGTLDGTFTYGTTDDSTVASVDASGTFTADGQGDATSTTDQSVLVGTLNVVTLGVTNSQTYSLTDATAGRYTSGSLLSPTTVLYAVSPNEFVLLNSGLTSPSIVLLQK